MPRPYTSATRRAEAERTRERIVAAARKILRSRHGTAELTIDAVAAGSNVARMTVYNAFKSKSGLLEAILDDISARGLPEIFPPTRSATGAFDSYLAAFAHFWESERLTLRRLRALAVLDRDVRAAVGKREKRRWNSTLELARQFADERGKPLRRESIDQFHIVASFESYDRLRIMGRGATEAAGEIRVLCQSILGLTG